jgi:hypothetical protein
VKRAVVALLVVCSLPALGGLVEAQSTDECVGPVERPAEAETVVVARGLRVVGDRYEKRPALAVGYGESARPVWARDLSDRGRFLGRSVETTSEGLLLVTQEGEHSVVELLGESRRPRWALRFGIGAGPRSDVDARDAVLEPERLVVADRTRLLAYDVGRDRPVREWQLPDDAFVDNSSHVSGVARRDGGYLVTVAGNGTGSVLALGDSGVEYRVDNLSEPHSPQELGETVLVAETGADRVVELDGDGTVVWSLTDFDRPQSAERLPGGTTLVSDRRNHRVLEVTPGGEVVWTAHVPWEPADATRDVSGQRPSAATLGVDGAHSVGGANATYDELAACEAGLLAIGENRTDRALSVAADGDGEMTVVAVVTALLVLGAVARRRR